MIREGKKVLQKGNSVDGRKLVGIPFLEDRVQVNELLRPMRDLMSLDPLLFSFVFVTGSLKLDMVRSIQKRKEKRRKRKRNEEKKKGEKMRRGKPYQRSTSAP